MNISGYGVASNHGGYNAKNASQTSSKPFTIPTEEVPSEKPAQTYKVTQSISFSNLTPKGYLSPVGYSKFDPFKEIAETGSFSFPELMQTKTTPTRSDEEILKDIEELAKEHARTGMSEQDDKRFAELMDEYVSSVSPDREGILRSNISEILERIANEMSGTAAEDAAEEARKKNGELIDYFMEALGTKKGEDKEKNDSDIMSNIIARGNNIATSSNNVIATRSDGYYTAVDYDRGGGKVTTLVYDNQGNKMPWFTMKSDMYDVGGIENGVVDVAEFYDSNGDRIATYDKDSGLLQANTKAEYERMKEIGNAYGKAYKAFTNSSVV